MFTVVSSVQPQSPRYLVLPDFRIHHSEVYNSVCLLSLCAQNCTSHYGGRKWRGPSGATNVHILRRIECVMFMQMWIDLVSFLLCTINLFEFFATSTCINLVYNLCKVNSSTILYLLNSVFHVSLHPYINIISVSNSNCFAISYNFQNFTKHLWLFTDY